MYILVTIVLSYLISYAITTYERNQREILEVKLRIVEKENRELKDKYTNRLRILNDALDQLRR